MVVIPLYSYSSCYDGPIFGMYDRFIWESSENYVTRELQITPPKIKEGIRKYLFATFIKYCACALVYFLISDIIAFLQGKWFSHLSATDNHNFISILTIRYECFSLSTCASRFRIKRLRFGSRNKCITDKKHH